VWGVRQYTLIDAAGQPYRSATRGVYGGHRVGKGYGRLDCPAALAAIERGGPYPRHRVFFADEATALAAGYRPCGRCLPERYRAWKAQSFAVWLPMPAPFAARELHAFLAARAIPGLESATATTFTRGGITLDFAARPETVPQSGTNSGLGVRIGGMDARDGVRIVRRVVDADAEPARIDAHLACDPRLAPLITARPGLRAPGAFDPWEITVRAIVGQAISVKAARTILTRLHADGLLTDREALSTTRPERLPLPRTRAEALVRTAAGEEDVKGIGPWTRGYIAMRTGDRDVLLDTDLIVRRAIERSGLDVRRAGEWAPFRSYVTHHLWQ
jgi:AraC family transcriptional regulator, regulatory protein of adaptative response / DNA-3-methyladenine glycosylase II